MRLLESVLNLSCINDLPAPHEMNNLIAVAGLHYSSDPFRSWEYLEIALDSHSIGGETQVGKQTRNAQTLGYLTRLSIHNNLNFRVH
jgi:hypothetical protein